MLIKKPQPSGFTIVELLIVIIVIAILATLVITAYNGVQAKARDAKRRNDLSAIQKALEIYHADNSGYPVCASGPYHAGDPLFANKVSCLTVPALSAYFSSGLQDPINSDSYQYFYAVGYRKTGPAGFVGDQSDNYILGARLETSGGSSFPWGSSTLNYLAGSNN